VKKTIIAVSLSGLCLGTACAEGTTVSVSGRIDAGYAFKTTQNATMADGSQITASSTKDPQGGTSTKSMTDNNATTSRLLFQAGEDLGNGYGAAIYLDLRFGNFFEGKNSSTTGGLNSNDRKSITFRTPVGYVQMGVQNPAGHTYTVAEKPYMSSPKDMNNIQYGVALTRETKLTQRATELRTNPITVGPASFALKGTYAFGDNRKSGTSSTDVTNSGDFYSGGFEGAYGTQKNVMEGTKPLISWGYDINLKTNSMLGAARKDSIEYGKVFYTVRPIPELKLASAYFVYKGYYGNSTVAASALGPAFREKNWTTDAQYFLGDKLTIGAYYSRLNDMGSLRNSGQGWGIGGYYYFTKTLAAALQYNKTRFERNETITGGKFDGTASGFIGNVNKLSGRATYLSLIKDF
jgi:hypothetical protein